MPFKKMKFSQVLSASCLSFPDSCGLNIRAEVVVAWARCYLALPCSLHRKATSPCGSIWRQSGHPRSPSCSAPPPGMKHCYPLHQGAWGHRCTWWLCSSHTKAWALSGSRCTSSCQARQWWRGWEPAGSGWQPGKHGAMAIPSAAPSTIHKQEGLSHQLLVLPSLMNPRSSQRAPVGRDYECSALLTTSQQFTQHGGNISWKPGW